MDEPARRSGLRAEGSRPHERWAVAAAVALVGCGAPVDLWEFQAPLPEEVDLAAVVFSAPGTEVSVVSATPLRRVAPGESFELDVAFNQTVSGWLLGFRRTDFGDRLPPPEIFEATPLRTAEPADPVFPPPFRAWRAEGVGAPLQPFAPPFDVTADWLE